MLLDELAQAVSDYFGLDVCVDRDGSQAVLTVQTGTEVEVLRCNAVRGPSGWRVVGVTTDVRNYLADLARLSEEKHETDPA